MKRRNFLKGLLGVPIATKAILAKEKIKPEIEPGDSSFQLTKEEKEEIRQEEDYLVEVISDIDVVCSDVYVDYSDLSINNYPRWRIEEIKF